MKHRKLELIGTACAMALLILDSRTAAAGASEGVELCVRTVIPSLFPFFVLSILLTGSLTELKLFRPVCRLFRIPNGCETILVSGLLGGYPVGAQAVAGAYSSGRISRQQANRMLAFCSQAGPSFLFGMAAGQFPQVKYGWMLWGIQIFSAWVISLIFPAAEVKRAVSADVRSITLAEAMGKAVRVMASVCGWVVLFRVVIGFAGRWFLWLLPREAQVAFSGILELTNGCIALTQIGDVSLRFVLCAGMLSFGGICVTMQTISVTEGLDMGYYLGGKLLQCLVSITAAGLLCGYLWAWVVPAVTAAVICLRKIRKSSSIPAAVGV